MELLRQLQLVVLKLHWIQGTWPLKICFLFFSYYPLIEKYLFVDLNENFSRVTPRLCGVNENYWDARPHQSWIWFENDRLEQLTSSLQSCHGCGHLTAASSRLQDLMSSGLSAWLMARRKSTSWSKNSAAWQKQFAANLQTKSRTSPSGGVLLFIWLGWIDVFTLRTK